MVVDIDEVTVSSTELVAAGTTIGGEVMLVETVSVVIVEPDIVVVIVEDVREWMGLGEPVSTIMPPDKVPVSSGTAFVRVEVPAIVSPPMTMTEAEDDDEVIVSVLVVVTQAEAGVLASMVVVEV